MLLPSQNSFQLLPIEWERISLSWLPIGLKTTFHISLGIIKVILELILVFLLAFVCFRKPTPVCLLYKFWVSSETEGSLEGFISEISATLAQGTGVLFP